MKPSPKRHERRQAGVRERVESFRRPRASHPRDQNAGKDCRLEALADFARAARGLKWTKPLFLLLLDELYIGDEFDQIIGPPELLAAVRYPGALAFAIALRHSWRPDDLAAIATALAARDSAHRTSSSTEQRHSAVERT